MRTREQRNEIRRLIRQYQRSVRDFNEGTNIETGWWKQREEKINEEQASIVLERLEDLGYDTERLIDSGS